MQLRDIDHKWRNDNIGITSNVVACEIRKVEIDISVYDVHCIAPAIAIR